MANTYKLISSNVLTTTAASVTFSSIPNTYTDLVFKIAARSNATTYTNNLRFYINGSTGNVYSFTRMLYDANAGTASSYTTAANGNELYFNAATTAASITANTFGNAEIYIPSYGSSDSKQMFSFQSADHNDYIGQGGMTAGLARISSPITSITIETNAGQSFVSGSSFYLYGISNS